MILDDIFELLAPIGDNPYPIQTDGAMNPKRRNIQPKLATHNQSGVIKTKALPVSRAKIKPIHRAQVAKSKFPTFKLRRM